MFVFICTQKKKIPTHKILLSELSVTLSHFALVLSWSDLGLSLVGIDYNTTVNVSYEFENFTEMFNKQHNLE